MGSAVSSAASQATSAASAASLMTGMTGTQKTVMVGMIFFSLSSLGLFIYSCVVASTIVGGVDLLKDNREKYNMVWGISIGGITSFLLAGCLYIYTQPDKGIYLGLVTACIALGISFNALAISAISKKTPPG